MVHKTRITREGFYYLFVLLFVIGGAVFREVNLLLVIAAIMIGPIIFSWRIVSATLSQLSVSRSTSSTVAAGMPLSVGLVISNSRRSLASWSLEVRERIDFESPWAGTESRTARVLFPCVPAGETAREGYLIRPTRRGRIRIGVATVATRFPWGFIAGSIVAQTVTEVLVTPRLGRLTPHWLHLIGARESAGEQADRTRATAQRRGLSDGEYYGLREWRPGDSRRWVHWRTSAKIGGMAVLQFDQRRNKDLVIVVDLWTPSQPTERDLLNVEWVVSFAGTVVNDICRRSSGNLTLAVVGDRARTWDRSASPMLSREVLEYLADVRPGCSRLEWDGAARASGAAKLIVLSTRPRAEGLFVAHETMESQWIEVGSERYAQLFHSDS